MRRVDMGYSVNSLKSFVWFPFDLLCFPPTSIYLCGMQPGRDFMSNPLGSFLHLYFALKARLLLDEIFVVHIPLGMEEILILVT